MHGSAAGSVFLRNRVQAGSGDAVGRFGGSGAGGPDGPDGFLTGMLCAGILTSQPAVTYAAETSATPEAGHSETYSQASDIDSVKGWPTGPNIEGQSAVLMDAVTDTILYSKNAKDKLYPASITKIMTALLACEYLDMNDTITMSQEAAYGIEAGSSSIYAETGEVFTVEQALMALMLESANEMALALAEKTSGSVKKFVELMNQRAAQLGCKNTHFNNPNGLPDETHYTTAGDMMKIAKAAWYNPRFRKFVTTQVYEIPPTNKQSETRYLLNHHKMMPGQSYAYDGVLGGKTGCSGKYACHLCQERKFHSHCSCAEFYKRCFS